MKIFAASVLAFAVLMASMYLLVGPIDRIHSRADVETLPGYVLGLTREFDPRFGPWSPTTADLEYARRSNMEQEIALFAFGWVGLGLLRFRARRRAEGTRFVTQHGDDSVMPEMVGIVALGLGIGVPIWRMGLPSAVMQLPLIGAAIAAIFARARR